MKNLNLIDKLIFLTNSVFALLLLLSLLVPYISPQRFPVLSLLSLAVAPLFLANALFIAWWTIRLKRQMLLSLIVIGFCITQFNSFYRVSFSGKKNMPEAARVENRLKVMSYNVRLFNRYDWLKNDTVPQAISGLIAAEAPDVVSFQEYSAFDEVSLSQFPHRFVKLTKDSPSFGQAIYSKYPIVDSGSLDFEDSANNAIYADIAKGTDTIRIYNIHLQSLNIKPDDVDFDQKTSKRLLRRMAASFKVQQHQAEKVTAHKKQCPHKTIVTADLNNTAFSYVYRKVKGDMNDAFSEAGKGLGKTFDFKKLPLRIDFILTDPDFAIKDFITHDEAYSDHFPISARLEW